MWLFLVGGAINVRSEKPTASARVDVNLEAIVGPRAQLQDAGLDVVGKILDVDGTRRLIDGRRLPQDLSGVVDLSLRLDGHLVAAVCTEKRVGGGTFW